MGVVEKEDFGNIKIVNNITLYGKKGEKKENRCSFYIELNGRPICKCNFNYSDDGHFDSYTFEKNVEDTFSEVYNSVILALDENDDNIPIRPIRKFIEKQYRIMALKMSRSVFTTNLNIGRSWYKLSIYDTISDATDEWNKNAPEGTKYICINRLVFIEDKFVGILTKGAYNDKDGMGVIGFEDSERLIASRIVNYLVHNSDGRLSRNKYKYIYETLKNVCENLIDRDNVKEKDNHDD